MCMGVLENPALGRDLAVGAYQDGVEVADIDTSAGSVVLIVTQPVQIEFFGLPGFSIFGKPVGIRCSLEGLLSDDPGNLVMTMAIPWRPGKPRNDDLWPEV